LCLVLDEEVDQVVQAALGHQDVVGIVDSGVTRLQGGHRAHGQGLLGSDTLSFHFLYKEVRQPLGTKMANKNW
jgi:hypothetical protein